MGDLDRCSSKATERTRPRAEANGLAEESDESVVPMKVVKATGGKGLYSGMRPLQGRRRRLWQH